MFGAFIAPCDKVSLPGSAFIAERPLFGAHQEDRPEPEAVSPETAARAATRRRSFRRV